MYDNTIAFTNLRKNIVPEASEENLKNNYFLKDDIGNGFSFISNKENFLNKIKNVFGNETLKTGLLYYCSSSYLNSVKNNIRNAYNNFENNKKEQIKYLKEYTENSVNNINLLNELETLIKEYSEDIKNDFEELKSSVKKTYNDYIDNINNLLVEENKNSKIKNIEIDVSNYKNAIDSLFNDFDVSSDYIIELSELFVKFCETLQENIYQLRRENTKEEIAKIEKNILDDINNNYADNSYIENGLNNKISSINNRIGKEPLKELKNELELEMSSFKNSYKTNYYTISSSVINDFKNNLTKIENSFLSKIENVVSSCVSNGHNAKSNFDTNVEYIQSKFSENISDGKNSLLSKLNDVLSKMSEYISNVEDTLNECINTYSFEGDFNKLKDDAVSNIELDQKIYTNIIGTIGRYGTTENSFGETKWVLDNKQEIENNYLANLKKTQNQVKQMVDNEYTNAVNNINSATNSYLNILSGIKNDFTDDSKEICQSKNLCINSLDSIEKIINNLNITTSTTQYTNKYYVYANVLLDGDENNYVLDENLWQNYMNEKDTIRAENSAAAKECLLNNAVDSSDVDSEDGINSIYDKNLNKINSEIDKVKNDINNFKDTIIKSLTTEYNSYVISTNDAYNNISQNIIEKLYISNNSIIKSINSYINDLKSNLEKESQTIKNKFNSEIKKEELSEAKSEASEIKLYSQNNADTLSTSKAVNFNGYINYYKNSRSINLLEQFNNSIASTKIEVIQNEKNDIEEAELWLKNKQKELLGFNSGYLNNDVYRQAMELLREINKNL